MGLKVEKNGKTVCGCGGAGTARMLHCSVGAYSPDLSTSNFEKW